MLARTLGPLFVCTFLVAGTAAAQSLTITKLEPNSVVAGNSPLNLTVTGTGFRQGSACLTVCGAICPRATVLLINQTELATTVDSSTQLRAVVPNSLLTQAGSLPLRARNQTTTQCGPTTNTDSNTLQLTVTPAPLQIEPSEGFEIGFGFPGAGDPDETRQITFTNSGPEAVTYTATFLRTEGKADLIAPLPGGTIAANSSRVVDLVARFSRLDPGSYGGEVTFRFRTVSGGPEKIVRFTAVAQVIGTEIFFSVPSIALTAITRNSSTKRPVTLSALAPSRLFVTVVEGGTWLKLTPATEGDSPLTFEVTGDASNLSPGDYVGRISGDTSAGNSPAVQKDLAVTLRVSPANVDLTISPEQVTCEIDNPVGLKASNSPIQITSPQAGAAFTATTATPWIRVTPGTGTAPANISIACEASQIPTLPASGIVTIAPASGTSRTVTVNAVARATQRRTIPQVAYGGGFTTTIAVVNIDTVPATFSLRFFRSDPASRTTFPSQLPLAAGAASENVVIQPGNAYVVQTSGQGAGPIVGWAEVVTNQNVTGFAVYRYQSGQTDQEAAVPLNTGSMQRFLLPFDNRRCSGTDCSQAPAPSFVTSMAVANLSTDQPAMVDVALRSLNGANLGGGRLPEIPPQGHHAFLLADAFPFAANQQGVAEFMVSTGQISAVGLRATPQLAFTSFEVQPPVAAGSFRRTFPQIADGGPLSTHITLVNTGGTPALVSLRFYRSNGRDAKTTSPWSPRFLNNAQTENLLIQPGAIYTLETAGSDPQTTEGWAELVSEGAVSGFAVYRLREGGKTQEAAVPLVVNNMPKFLLPFENRNGFVTAIAMANISSAQPANLQATVRSASGATLGSRLITIPPSGHTAFALDQEFAAATQGNQGIIEFVVVSGQVSAMGLRFTPGNPRALTSFEALAY